MTPFESLPKEEQEIFLTAYRIIYDPNYYTGLFVIKKLLRKKIEALWPELGRAPATAISEAAKAALEGKGKQMGHIYELDADGNILRCLITKNPVGTDTWMEGHPCKCNNCQLMLVKAELRILKEVLYNLRKEFEEIPRKLEYVKADLELGTNEYDIINRCIEDAQALLARIQKARKE